MVQTIVLPVSATFLTARMTIAAALASKPVVGSSMKIMEGLATSSTAIVSRLRCSVDRPVSPGMPTKSSFIPSSSMVSRTSLTKSCNIMPPEFEFMIPSNFDFSFDNTTTFSSRKNIKKCCFTSTSDTHQCSKNTRPECTLCKRLLFKSEKTGTFSRTVPERKYRGVLLNTDKLKMPKTLQGSEKCKVGRVKESRYQAEKVNINVTLDSSDRRMRSMFVNPLSSDNHRIAVIAIIVVDCGQGQGHNRPNRKLLKEHQSYAIVDYGRQSDESLEAEHAQEKRNHSQSINLLQENADTHKNQALERIP
ncbi:hypothetical protein RJ640_009809 [Escallonia rubra]|uniref:Uncharacterized protein n=1 Tax=Escallonia rubra TaxID=112253 RepID=A0AA88QWJ9_9ASTE|nr:hypothetical protein RJ640_009809 [Escallonia rubra]